MAEPLVLVDREGAVARLVLNRPERRNALNVALMEALGSTLHEMQAAPWCHAVVLTGAGSAFCAGGDMSTDSGVMSADTGADVGVAVTRHRQLLEAAERLLHFTKPTVAAVNGAAIGAGFSLALLCDEVVLHGDAKLSLNFLQLGLPPDLLSAVTVQRRAGWTVATDLFHTGRLLPAREAVELRLAHEVVDDDVIGVASRRAAALAELSPFAFATAKLMLRQAFSPPAADLEALAVGAAVGTEQFQSAVAGYRRPPPVAEPTFDQ